MLASATVNNVAICFKRNDGAVSSFGEYGLSCGLHVSLCTLQLTCSAFTSAVAVATLGRSGWLILTPQGLSPCKKRQASLGALTAQRSAARRARVTVQKAETDTRRSSVCSGVLGGVSNSECFKSDAQWPRLRKGEIEFFKTDYTP